MCARLRAWFKNTLCLSFTTKSTFKHSFHNAVRDVLFVENVAHFFPPRKLHLDLTFWVVPISLTVKPSQGKLATAVYRREKARGGEVERGLSVLEQAPLGGSETPSSPLGFKLALVVPWRMLFVLVASRFRAKHSGVSNPSLFLSFRGVKGISKATFV